MNRFKLACIVTKDFDGNKIPSWFVETALHPYWLSEYAKKARRIEPVQHFPSEAEAKVKMLELEALLDDTEHTGIVEY